ATMCCDVRFPDSGHQQARFWLAGVGQSWSSTSLAKNAVLGTAEEIFVLDNAFALKNQHKGGPARLETDSYQGTPSGVPPTTHPCRPAPIGRNCHRTLLHSALSSKPRSA